MLSYVPLVNSLGGCWGRSTCVVCAFVCVCLRAQIRCVHKYAHYLAFKNVARDV